MDVTAIIDRLRDQLTGYVHIGGAADAAQAYGNAIAAPSVYVIPLAETGDAPDTLGVYRQDMTQQFGVVLVMQNLRDATGAAAAGELNQRRLDLRAALLGWAPNATEGEPVMFVAGRLLEMQQQQLWWQDEFSFKTHYQGA